MTSTKLTVHAYDWTVDDAAAWNEEDHVAIHAWCLDRESKPYLLRFVDFPAFCYIELPQFIGGRYTRWDETKVARFMEWLEHILKEDAPYRGILKYMPKVYYYRGQRRDPMILALFRTVRAMQHCQAFLQKGHKIDQFGGYVICNIWETEINIVRKLLTLQNCRYSQWFTIDAVPVDEDVRISTLEHEYIVAWRSLAPIPNSETKSWTTFPRLLAFDIECYSNNHKAMPRKTDALHVAYMISLIYQRVGQPNTRKRYAIILGDCEAITLPASRPPPKPGEPEEKVPGDLRVEVIRVNNELDLIDTMSRLIRELDPEIITGYNILGFDYPYLDARLKRKRLPRSERNPDGFIWQPMGRLRGKYPTMTSKTWRSDAYGFQEINIMSIDGRISIDLLPLIRRDYKLDKYDLGFVSQFFFGEGKTKHDIKAPEMFCIFEDLKRTQDEYLQIADKYSLPRSFSEIYASWQNNSSVTLNSVPEEARVKVETFIQTCRNVSDASPPSPHTTTSVLEYHKAIENMTRVMRYCIQDSELVVDLFEILSIWIALVEMSNIVGVTVMELFTRGQQVRCLSQIYDLASQKGYVLDKRTMTPVKFSGGFVHEPIPGLYENIICLDFASLYPSIIQAFNICFTTLVPPELETEIPDTQCNVIEFDQEEIGEVEDDSDDEALDDDQPKKKKKPEKTSAHRRYRFIKADVHRGILPELVKRLVEERRAVRSHLDGKQDETTGTWIVPKEKDPVIRIVLDKRQNALKVTANSFFGFLGVQDGGKMPLIEAAMSITAKGRELINTVNRYLRQRYGGTIVYGDSVTADTPLLLRYQGVMYYRRISDLVEFSESDRRDDGKQEKNVTGSGVDVWSDQGWTPIKRVIRHRTTKQLYRILTHTGCVDVTEDHSMLRPNGTEVAPRDLKVHETLLHSTLPLLEDPRNQEHHIDLPSAELPAMTLGEKIAWVFGLFYAEGSCGSYDCPSGKKSSWAISNQEVSILEHAKSILTQIHPGYEFRIGYYMDSSACNKLQVCGNDIAEFCRFYRNLFYTGISDCDPNHSYKIVPDIIVNSSIAEKRAFLNGYYAGDGEKVLVNRRWDNKGKIGTAGLFYLAKSIGYKVSLNSRCDKMDVFRCTATLSPQRKNPYKIKKIISLGSCDDYVYDLETENHHFAAGIGELVVHNTDSCMVDLHITNSKECNKLGHQLSEEISGNPEKGIPGLFPPPLRMEFEKAMRLLCIKKKKYAAALIDKEGNHKLADKDILKKGIVLARRDNCKWLRRVYMNVLRNILTSKPIHETMDIIVDSILDLLQGRVSYKELIIIRELNSNYKSQTYFMKVFADQLRRLGKQANPGDRLEYVVVDTKNPADKVGMRMRLPEMYLESQGTPQEEKIDTIYYLDHVLKNPIDQLFQIGYKRNLETMERLGYKPKGRYKERNIREPVEMMIHMIQDQRDISLVKIMIRYPEQYQAALDGIPPSVPTSGPRRLQLVILAESETKPTQDVKKIVLE